MSPLPLTDVASPRVASLIIHCNDIFGEKNKRDFHCFLEEVCKLV